MNLFALELLPIGVYKNTNDSNFVLYGGPDSSLKDTWMNLFAFELLPIGVYKNTNDTNFFLYMDPDSSLKGPYVP